MPTQWRIRDLRELCLRRVVACLSQDEASNTLLSQQLAYLPASVLEEVWAFAAESDRLSDALVRSSLTAGSELSALELGRVPLGVTERGLTKHTSGLPPACAAVRVGWPAHFGASAAEWLTRALHARAKGGGVGLARLELRAAGLGGGQGGVVPATWRAAGPSGDDGDGADDAHVRRADLPLMHRGDAAATT